MVPNKKKIEIVEKYLPQLATSFKCYTWKDVSSKKLENAIKKFARGLKTETVLGFYDTSIMGNGTSGYIFTDEKVYYHQALEKPGMFWYEDIESVELLDFEEKDCNNELLVFFHDGMSITINETLVNKTPLCSLLQEMAECVAESPKSEEQDLDVSDEELSSFEIANIFRERISSKRLAKNLTATTAKRAKATSKLALKKTIGKGVGLNPIGKLGMTLGSAAVSATVGAATGKIHEAFIGENINEMIKILQSEFKKLAKAYRLNIREAEKAVDKLMEELDGESLEYIYKSDDKEEYARDVLIPIIEDVVSRRNQVLEEGDD